MRQLGWAALVPGRTSPTPDHGVVARLARVRQTRHRTARIDSAYRWATGAARGQLVPRPAGHITRDVPGAGSEVAHAPAAFHTRREAVEHRAIERLGVELVEVLHRRIPARSRRSSARCRRPIGAASIPSATPQRVAHPFAPFAEQRAGRAYLCADVPRARRTESRQRGCAASNHGLHDARWRMR